MHSLHLAQSVKNSCHSRGDGSTFHSEGRWCRAVPTAMDLGRRSGTAPPIQMGLPATGPAVLGSPGETPNEAVLDIRQGPGTLAVAG